MPQLATINLHDTADANHAFTPVTVTNGIASWSETSGVPIGNKTITMSLNKTPNGRYKAVIKFAMPVVQTQTVNGVSNPIVVRTAYADITLTFDQTSSLAERQELVKFLNYLFGTSNGVSEAVWNLQGVY